MRYNKSNKTMMKNKADIDEKILEELKKALLEKREKINEQLSSFAKKTKNIKDDYETKFPHIGDSEDENADEVSMYEDSLSVEHELEADLLSVNRALKKMEEGTYGICYNCGAPKTIEIERLRAYPEAETCLDCDRE